MSEKNVELETTDVNVESEVTEINIESEEAENNTVSETSDSRTGGNHHHHHCVEIKENETLGSCRNESIRPHAIDHAIAKIPVVLKEFTIKLNLTSKIKLDRHVTEIKEIKKRVKVTQCMLIGDTNVLYIKGYIRKNIMYASHGHHDCDNHKGEGFCGDIKYCTVDVPFQCTTEIHRFITEPAEIINNTSDEFEFFRTGKLPKSRFAEKDKLLSGDFTEFNQESTEYFNELPYCELIASRIVEYDEFLNRHPHHTNHSHDLPVGEIKFNKIEEKMVVYLRIKLLQNRQVRIGSPTAETCEE